MTHVQIRRRQMGQFLAARMLRDDSAVLTVMRIALVLAGVMYVALRLNQGWVPHDEGTLAQSAQRVLDGELPHRDFAELYTGGLTFLNAGVFKVAGDNLFWLRVPMFLLFLAYLPCVYLIARRFASRAVATLAALFAVAWGPPVYPAAMPSWYTLFLAVIGAYFLLRHHESGRRGWLFAAGLAGGLSLCCKITGVWYMLAVLVYLAYRAGDRCEPVTQRGGGVARLATLAFVSVPVASALFVGAVLAEKLGPADAVNLLLPVVSVCALTAWECLRRRHEGFGSLAALCGAVIVVLAGLAIPLAAVAAPYVLTGSLGDLYTGLFVTPRGRLESGYPGTAAPVALVFAAPTLVILTALRKHTAVARKTDIVATAALAAVLLLSAATLVGYVTMWFATTSLLPVGVVLGVVLLGRARTLEPGSASDRSYLVLLLGLSAFVGLVQFPFGAPVYFCFVAPLAMLAWVAMFRHTSLRASVGRVFPVALLAGIVGFGFVVNHNVLYWDGTHPNGNPQTVVLDRDRAWIRVSPSQRDVYLEVMGLLRAHARGSYVYAGPDTPEIYALTGLRNPTRSLFDYLDPTDSARGQNLLRTLRRHGVTAIVVNARPGFSMPLEPSTLVRLREDYPVHERVGPFDVRWRP
jgi:hypothetical protein